MFWKKQMNGWEKLFIHESHHAVVSNFTQKGKIRGVEA